MNGKESFSRIVKMILVAGLVLTGCGKPGTQGAVGPSGAQGIQGESGVAGTNGIDATPITVVQFCQACITHYPDKFAEVGFCIGGNLYATYSANDGFSVLIPPGTYHSNGINCSCTFTVANNCGVN